MNAAELLALAATRGVRVSAKGGNLVCVGRQSRITELLPQLKAHKLDLLEALHRPDAVVLPLSTPNGPCQVTIPRNHYDPDAFTTFADRLALTPPAAERDPQRWRSAEITAPDMRTITVTTPDGWGQVYWRQLARAYFPRGHVIHTSDPVGQRPSR